VLYTLSFNHCQPQPPGCQAPRAAVAWWLLETLPVHSGSAASPRHSGSHVRRLRTDHQMPARLQLMQRVGCNVPSWAAALLPPG